MQMRRQIPIVTLKSPLIYFFVCVVCPRVNPNQTVNDI